jgi:serine-protein kinase ATM
MVTIKDFLREFMGKQPQNSDVRKQLADDADFRAPNQLPRLPAAGSYGQESGWTTTARKTAVEVCMSFLSLAPILQSPSGESTRDRELVELVLESSEGQFLVMGPAFLNNVRRRTLDLNITNLGRFLEKFEPLLQQYTLSHDEQLQILIIQFLDATLDMWTQTAIANTQAGEQIRILYEWLSRRLSGGKIRSWRIRDRFSLFLGRYLHQDPSEQVLSMEMDERDERSEQGTWLPSVLLPSLGTDEDIRVRFRVAVTNARLFSMLGSLQHEPMTLYRTITGSLSKNVDE